jgi:hypothetical protein
MAFKSAVVTIADTPTLISFASALGRKGHKVYIQNISTTVDFYIGGSDVTTSNGYLMHRASSATVGDDIMIEVGEGEELYAVVATGTGLIAHGAVEPTLPISIISLILHASDAFPNIEIVSS